MVKLVFTIDTGSYIGMECSAIKVPGLKELDLLTGGLSPGVAVRQRCVKSECDNAHSQESRNAGSSNCRSVPDSEWASCPVRCEIVDLTHSNDREVECWEVMMKKELTLHQIKGEVMECPTQDRSTNLVIKALEVDIIVILISSLPAKNGKSFENEIDTDGEG